MRYKSSSLFQITAEVDTEDVVSRRIKSKQPNNGQSIKFLYLKIKFFSNLCGWIPAYIHKMFL